MSYAPGDVEDQEETTFLSHPKETGPAKKNTKNRVTVLKYSLFSILAVAALAIGALGFEGQISLGKESIHPQIQTVVRDCGDNPTTARHLGCVFDEISFTWDQPACYNSELSNDFRERFGFRYFADWEGQEEIPSGVVALGERDLKSTLEQHLIHCVYVWRKFHSAYNTGQPIDSYIGNLNHTYHCGEQWIEQVQTPHNISSIKVKIIVKYTSCRVSV